MKFFLLLFLVCILPGGPGGTEQLGLPGYARKKADKRLAEIWPGKIISLDKVQINEETLALITPYESNVDLFVVKNGTQKLGFLYLDLARGKFEDITYMTLC